MEPARPGGFSSQPLHFALPVWNFVVCPGKGKGEKKESLGLGGIVRKYLTPLQIIGLTGAYVVALEPLGYLLASTLYLFALLLGVSRYRIWIAAVLAVVFGTGSWFFFEKLLATQLPKGLLPL